MAHDLELVPVGDIYHCNWQNVDCIPLVADAIMIAAELAVPSSGLDPTNADPAPTKASNPKIPPTIGPRKGVMTP